MNLRLKKAAYFLQNSPEMNISDIAYRLGFGNPQYFNKCTLKNFLILLLRNTEKLIIPPPNPL